MSSKVKRILTAAIGLPLIIAILLAPVNIMLIAVAVCSIIGVYEYIGTVGIRQKSRILSAVMFLSAAFIPLCIHLRPIEIMTMAALCLVVMFLIMLLSDGRIDFVHISLSVMGLIYIPFMLSHILYVRHIENGNIIVWLVFLGSFMTDSCAYFTGSAIGRHKLCPKISPKKTIEGAIGGTIGCGLSFILFAFIINAGLSGLLGGVRMSYLSMFSLGLLCAISAQIGDLTASLIKRKFGIKDFGNLFPGHGGMLDRCDSIILVAPTVFLFASQINLFI